MIQFQTNNMVSVLVASLAVASSLVATSASDATEYIVGNTSGWVVPNGRVNVFNTWAAEYDFHVGDTLVFNFVKGMHDVAEVSKEDYEACNARNAMWSMTDGPAKIKLESAGDHYFICSFPDHCLKGQRVAIKVGRYESLTEASPTALQAAEGLSTTVAIVGMHSLSKQTGLTPKY